MKKLILIPGFGEDGTEACYMKIKKEAKAKGFLVQTISIQWDYLTMSHYIEQAKQQLKSPNDEAILFGFSFGAFIALQLGTEYKFKKVLVASCSPYFKENLPLLPQEAITFFGKRRMKDFENFSIANIKIKNACFFFGEYDWSIAIKTAQKIALQNNSPFKKIPNTGHELSEAYISTILKEL